MLNRNMRFALYEADNTDSATTDTQQDKTGQGAEEKLFSQADLDKHIASTKKSSRDKALKDYFAELGTDDASIKALLTKTKADEEAQKTEAQKLQDEIAQLKKERDSEKEARSQVEKQRRLDKRDSELKMLLSKAQDADKVLILMKATEGEKLESLLDENGNFDKVNGEKFVAEFSKNNAYLFKDTRIGSALSNRDGKAPEPNKDLKEAAAKRTFKNMRNNI